MNTIETIASLIATALWIALAIYGFAFLRKWNKRFSELHEAFKKDMEL